MVDTSRSKNGTHANNNVPENVSTEGHQPLSAEVLQNLNQFLITQTQLMQLLMQRMNGNNVSSAPVPAAPEECSCKELPKDKPQEVPHNEEVSHFLPEDRHPWKFVHCYRCGDQGHFAYGCPQKGKPKQEIHCAHCNRIGHRFTKCSRKMAIQDQVCY